MNGHTSSTPCECAAERIKLLFSRDKEKIAYSVFLEQKKILKSLIRASVKLSKLPSDVQTVSLNKITTKDKKKNPPKEKQKDSLSKALIIQMQEAVNQKNPENPFCASAINVHRCCTKNQKHPSLLLDADAPKENVELTAERVIRLKLKEYLIAARKFHHLHLESQKTVSPANSKQVTLMGKRGLQKEEELKQIEAWQEFIQAKEERHFQIGRVIKYLSE